MHDTAQNQIWLEIVQIALGLSAIKHRTRNGPPTPSADRRERSWLNSKTRVDRSPTGDFSFLYSTCMHCFPSPVAIAAYEADMRAATYPITGLAADHSRVGGGGLRWHDEPREVPV